MNILSIFTLLLIKIYGAYSTIEYDSSATIKLQHSLNKGPDKIFTERGNITIHSLRVGQAIVTQKPLTPDEQQQLKELAALNELYQIKAIAKGSDNLERSFVSTVKACMLAEAELNDILSVSLDYQGRIIGVTLVVASKSTCEGAVVPLSQLKEFTTSVYIRHAEIGPIPDTATYLQKLEREREAKERGEVKDNRSFLAKYWMYIVPVVIIMVLSSAANPDGSGGQGGQ